jgi:hypothetical protein
MTPLELRQIADKRLKKLGRPSELTRALYVASDEIDRLRSVLESIAKNTCCDKCQEAALVAKAALKQ